MKLKYHFLFLLLFLPICRVNGQAVNSWQSYSSFRTITTIVNDKNGNTWCTTKGGLFEFKDGTIKKQFTTIDGMYNIDPTAMVYDASNNGLWLGYSDGMVEFYDIGKNEFTRYPDIYRATRYNPRGINKMLIKNDSLFVATDFGVVLYDTQSGLVLDTYTNLGNLVSGTQVNDIDYSGTTLYCATAQGVAAGDESKGDLIEPNNWTNYDASNGFTDNSVSAIGYFNGKIYATTGGNNYEYDGSSWGISSTFKNGGIVRYVHSSEGKTFIGVSNTVATLINSTVTRLDVPNGQPLLTAYDTGGNGGKTIYVGTSNDGVAISKDYTSNKVDNYIVPDGPYLNLFSGLNVDNGVLISGSSPVPGQANSPIVNTGYYIYKGSKWSNYNLETDTTLSNNNINSIYISTYNKEAYYFGSWGYGIVERDIANNKETLYNNSNGLEGITGSSSFIVITGLDKDSKGNIWAVSLRAPTYPLVYHVQGTDKWIGLHRSPYVSSSDIYYGLMIDSNDQKWISLYTAENQGDGILVLDTGDLSTENDDVGYHLTTDINQGYLPDMNVNAMVEDKQGVVWVGTNRGVVRYVFPDQIINGTASDRQAEYLRKAGTDSLLLRDLNTTAIAVDAADRKWIGSDGDGLWLVNEAGDSVLKHFTTSNSPLISNNITSLAVDDKTGKVYIATDQGLVSYVSVVKGPVAKMNKLFIYPNPYSYSKQSGPIVISGLSAETTIRIITIDGRLVDKLDVTGGRAEWNGLDYNGNRVATGVYLVVAVDKHSNNRGVGKVVIIR